MRTPEELARIVHIMMGIKGKTAEETLKWVLLKEELYEAYNKEQTDYEEETIMARLSGVPEQVILKLESYDRDQRLALLHKFVNAYQDNDHSKIRYLEFWVLRCK